MSQQKHRLSQLVALPASDPTAPFGSIVYWSLSGTVCVAALRELADTWEPAPLPRPPEHGLQGALNVAMTRVFGRENVRHVDELRARIVMEEKVEEEEEKKSWHARARYIVRLDNSGQIQCEGGVPDTMKTLLEEAMHRARTEHAAIIVSGWLCSIIEKHFNGVRIRASGGVYYVPPSHLERWRKLTDALSKISEHDFYYIPAMRTQEAAEAIVSALNAEIAKEVSAVRLLTTYEKPPTKGALTRRTTQVAELRNKLRSYESLLGQSLGQLAEELTDVDNSLAQIAAAALIEE